MDREEVYQEGERLLVELKEDTNNKAVWFDGLFNQWFRLNTLYDITDRDSNHIQFKPNPEQTEYYRSSHNRDIILKARQLGFTTFKQIQALDNCLFNGNHRAACIAQDVETVKEIFDDKVKFAYENIDHDLIKWITDGEFELPKTKADRANAYKFSNGSRISVGTGKRGGTLQDLHVSEFGKICKLSPDKAKEILTGSLEAVAKGGNATFESTAEGSEGKFFDLCEGAKGKENPSVLQFKLHFFAWHTNPEYSLQYGDITPRLDQYFSDLEHKNGITLDDGQKRWYSAKEELHGDDIFREYPSVDDEPFKVSIDGAYYSKQFSKIYKEKRIGEALNDGHVNVYTAWDIGTGDSTAIWFYTKIGDEIHLIDYYENNGVGLDHYLKLIHDKPYGYAKHYAPHDMNHRQFANKAKTLKDLAKEGLVCEEDGATYKLNFEIVPISGVNDGIALVRDLLSRCYFYQVDDSKLSDDDKRKTVNRGVKCLENYRKEWDKKKGVWKDNPLHDWASDGADAFRYLANMENGKKTKTFFSDNAF